MRRRDLLRTLLSLLPFQPLAFALPVTPQSERSVRLFLCGDVMTGRGIDQILPHPGDPRLYEGYMNSARDYVDLARQRTGPIPERVDCAYIWGEALPALNKLAPDLRLINLETAVTTANEPAPKGINYRMHPANTPCLKALGVDGAALANNHVLDWGVAGLEETLTVLHDAGIATAGAGINTETAAAPAIWTLPGRGRVLLFAFAHPSSGTPAPWAAGQRPGVNFLPDLAGARVEAISRIVHAHKRTGDIALVSVHWGSNWGYAIPPEQTAFAHALIDQAGVDVVWGHSSHHPRPLEVYRGKLVLYGCGDFMNDYEGIEGFENFQPELVLLYLASVNPHDGTLASLNMVPLHLRHFRLEAANASDAAWLARTLSRESRHFGSRLLVAGDGGLELRWSAQP